MQKEQTHYDETETAATDEEKTVVSHLFENLMKLQSDGSGGTTAVNGVARSYQCDTTAEGQETYTFKLRSSAAWSDGTKVTAQDFVYAWKRLVDPLTGSKNARILDMVAGYSAARTGEDALQVSAPDDETFVVALSGRCPYFIDSVCTAAATMPVQSAAAAQENWSMSPDTLVTNGPYTVASWENDTMLLQQTDGYHDARRLGPMSISFRFTADAKTANSLFEKGDADFVLGLTDEAVAKKIDSWMPDYYPETSVVLLNQLSDLTSNENVRRAMGLVIDRNAKGQQTVHFMNLVDEADLLALMEEEDADAYTAEKEAAAQAEQERKQAEEDVANEPKVSFRNGQFIVTDGQHTIEGRILRNGGKDLPILCKVYTGMTVEQEALLFAEQNGFSAPLTAGIKLRAKVVGGDAISKAFLAATNRVGLSLNYDSQQLTDYRIGCVGTAFRLYKQMGEPLYCETMRLIVAAWEGKPDSFRASVLKGMMHFVELYHGEFNEERLLRALRNIHPVDIYRIGQDDPAKLRGWKKYVFPIYTAYNGKCRKDALSMKF